ncbi:hypothetical protein J7M28_00295 [bacterium]|nr:hypothetical protein [bacterium]
MRTADRSEGHPARMRGNRFGFWFFRLLIRVLGLRVAYSFLYIVCAYYLLFDPSAVSAAVPYVARRFPESGRLKRHLHIYRLFISQGKQLIDRSAILHQNDLFDLKLKGHEEFVELLENRESGLILLTAHVGNWQLALSSLGEMKRDVYLLMRPEHNVAVNTSLRVRREEKGIKIISAEDNIGGALQVMNVLAEGHIVSIMGDRSYGFDTVEVPFLGDTARFPFSAFVIAAAAKCPVAVLLSAKVSEYGYLIDVSHILYPKYKSARGKRGQIASWVRNYAAILQDYIDDYPYQCFLFFDIWGDDERIE